MRKFTIFYYKQRTKKDVAERKYLENQLKTLIIFMMIMAICQATTTLKTKLKKYMKKREKVQE